MRLELLTRTIEFRMFDRGERVRPTSPRCPLAPGVYVVRECLAPTEAAWDCTDSVVFVEGHPHGVDGCYLASEE